MSFATITAAQRLDVRNTALQVDAVTQPFAQNGLAPTTAELALITPVLTKAAAALSVAGATGLPDTSTVVANGNAVPVNNSAGTAVAGTHSASVAGGALVSVNLADTVAPVEDGKSYTFPVSGTGTTVKFTVADGVITGATIS